MPFVHNHWYAAAWSADLGDEPLARRILGQSIVLFRRAHEGTVAVLNDLCPHRFVPLSLGKVVNGGRLRCAYHGLEFDGAGGCVHNPHTNGRIPPAAKVKSHTALERHGMIWVWLGDRKADPARIPDYAYLDSADPSLVGARQQLVIKANYTIVVNNLLDLSHACVLHEGVLGNEMMDAEIDVEEMEDAFIVRRLMQDVPAPKFIDLLFRNNGGRVDSWADIRLMGISCLLNHVGVSDPGVGRGGGTSMLGAHILTPMDEETTLYHFCSMRQNPPERSHDDNIAIAREISSLARQAFSEQDAVVMEAQQAMLADPAIDTSRPALFDVDKGAARFERHLKTMLAADKHG